MHKGLPSSHLLQCAVRYMMHLWTSSHDKPVDIIATCAEHLVLVSSCLIQRTYFNVLVHLEHGITAHTSLRTALAQYDRGEHHVLLHNRCVRGHAGTQTKRIKEEQQATTAQSRTRETPKAHQHRHLVVMPPSGT
jgi:hypothetical protein